MQSEEEFLKKICDGFLRKPVSRVDLAAKMRPYCKTRMSRHAPVTPLPIAQVATKRGLDTDARKKLPDLLRALDGSRAEWKALVEAPLVSEVEQFGRQLLSLADAHANPLLRDYAEKLTGCAARFDMVGMETALQAYEELVADLNRLVANTP